MTTTFITALFAFAGHLGLAVVLAAAFILIYMRTTPHEEMELIRQGNMAAAIGLAGALLGICLVLSNTIRISHGLLETLVWGVIALAVQVAGHYIASRILPRLYQAISEGDVAAGILKASIAVGLGMLNAASMTP